MSELNPKQNASLSRFYETKLLLLEFFLKCTGPKDKPSKLNARIPDIKI